MGIQSVCHTLSEKKGGPNFTFYSLVHGRRIKVTIDTILYFMEFEFNVLIMIISMYF